MREGGGVAIVPPLMKLANDTNKCHKFLLTSAHCRYLYTCNQLFILYGKSAGSDKHPVEEFRAIC